MASLELQKAVAGYENYINQHGVDEEVVNAYVEAVKWGFYKDNDKESGLLLANKSKQLINQFVSVVEFVQQLLVQFSQLVLMD